jgi:hypothetical protein
MIHYLLLSCFAVLSFGLSSAFGGQSVTTKTLLSEMFDLAGMSEFPSPAYTTKQSSSYDRSSISPADGWFSNDDCGHYLRVEDHSGRREYVMMEAKGPGALVRIWSANPAGILRIYLDGDEHPAIEAPMSELLGGDYPGLSRPLAGEHGRGWTLYFPIPYAKHCKVTCDRGKIYYHVNYRAYEAGTGIESFRPAYIQTLASEIDSVVTHLKRASESEQSGTKPFKATLPPGESAVLGSFSGEKAITGFAVRWTPSADHDEPALHAVVLTMAFDGDQTVEAPLGDFFGSSPGLNAHASLPLSMSKEGRLECRWVMPFAKTAEIRVRNHGKTSVTFDGSCAVVERPWTDHSMHFHAKWRSAFDVATEPKIDWNYIVAKGSGVFVGATFSIDNPVVDWWGEGDEKIYVDGEKFPGYFGTGTEDYYGYGWCSTNLFTHAYHNQSRCDGPGNYGRTSVNRWHILDRIPFQKDFRFDMELWHWARCRVNMALLAYWYARPGATDSFTPITAGDVVLRPMPAFHVPGVKEAIEGESMSVISGTGVPRSQLWGTSSAGAHLWWSGGQRPGDTLVLGFNVEKTGRYTVKAQLLKAVDYGITQILVNGAKMGDPIDCYHEPGVQAGPPLELGSLDLRAGENTIAFVIIGANPKAKKAYMIGLDYLLLVPAK